MPEEIFISYSRKDSDRVMPLVKQLREDGYSVWLDDSHIESASLWAEQIVEGLKNCKVLMLMCSKDSLASKNVLKEVMLASELEKTLLPVYLEECELPSRFQYQLAGIQHIDFFKPSDKKPVEQLSDALDSTNLVKLGNAAQLSDQIQLPKSGHKFILNKWKYIISGIIGYITILFGVMFMAMGNFDMVLIMEEFTFSFLISIFLVTFGALFFSYRSSAFKPWLVPFGYKVPEEEEIIHKYVKICISAKNILCTIALILIIVGINSGIPAAFNKNHQDVSPYYAPSNLIANGADVNSVTADGWTPLHFAATHDAKMINLLIKNGAKVNVKSYAYKWTPLHIASGRLGNLEIVKALISAGADINTKTSKLDEKSKRVSGFGNSEYHGYGNSGYENIVTGINNEVYVQVDPEKEITALDVAIILENIEIENFLRSVGGRTGEQLVE